MPPSLLADFYAGFEGSVPELRVRLVRNNADDQVIRMPNGFMSDILQLIRPGPNGWTGITRSFHLGLDWTQSSPWELDNPSDAIAQISQITHADFDAIPSNYRDDCWRIHSILLDLLGMAIAENGRLLFEYD